MFFMMGMMNGRKDLNFNQLFVCDRCGQYGRYKVYMTYMVLSLFFIPIFKWSKKYYVETSCCGTVYQIHSELGRRIEHGEEVELQPDDLERIGVRSYSVIKRCDACGFQTEEDYEYCPKCGKRF